MDKETKEVFDDLDERGQSPFLLQLNHENKATTVIHLQGGGTITGIQLDKKGMIINDEFDSAKVIDDMDERGV